ncbi:MULTISPECIES: hypothetical protein [unclassified Variovorax]|uniref:hypothetical protein n=1 Tax=unclassified Variovorax TaxID=663243 RepID=UPI003F47E8CF
MTATLDFIRERDGGFTRVSTVSSYGTSQALLLKSFGLEPQADALSEVTREVAAACISALLWRDMAYSSTEFMPKQKAEGYAQGFLEEYAAEGARFFTNGRWDQFHGSSGFPYSPLTGATFSAVVLVACPGVATCLLVEDED